MDLGHAIYLSGVVATSTRLIYVQISNQDSKVRKRLKMVAEMYGEETALCMAVIVVILLSSLSWIPILLKLVITIIKSFGDKDDEDPEDRTNIYTPHDLGWRNQDDDNDGL